MQIKDYAKSLLSRNKTDKVDAKIIASYAQAFIPRDYVGKTADEELIKEPVQLIDTLGKQKRQLQNQLESIDFPIFVKYSSHSKEIKKAIDKMIDKIDKQIGELEASLKLTLENNSDYASIKKHLMSIVGIGEKTAHQIIAHFPRVSEFQNAKQLAAYALRDPQVFSA